MTEPLRTTTIRLPEALAARLDLAAESQGIAMVEAIRLAITAYVDAPRVRAAVREGLRKRVEQAQQLLDALDNADPLASATETESP